MTLLRLVSLVVALLLTAALPARAALFTGDWDPIYGSPFDVGPEVLGWRGSATFYVPDECLVVGTVSSSTCSGMQLVNGQVVFYDYLTDQTVETFYYAPSDLSGFSATFGAGGVLNSFSTNFFAQRNPTSDFAHIDLYGFRLQFVAAGARMYHTIDIDLGHLNLGPIDPSHCPKWAPGFICGYSGTYSDGTNIPAVVVTYSRVPEPSSLLFLAAGLLGIAFASRIARLRKR